eukprot:2212913-Rhodomonas_salina.1
MEFRTIKAKPQRLGHQSRAIYYLVMTFLSGYVHCSGAARASVQQMEWCATGLVTLPLVLGLLTSVRSDMSAGPQGLAGARS